MHRFFLAHLFKHLGCSRIRFAQPIGKLPVNAAVFFFAGDGQGQNFSLGQILESLEHMSFSEEMYRRESHKKLPEAIMMRRGKTTGKRFPQPCCWAGTFVLSSSRTRPTFCRVRPLYGFSLSGCLCSVLQEMQFLGKGEWQWRPRSILW